MKEGKPRLCYILTVYKRHLYPKVYSGEILSQTLEILFHSTFADLRRTLTRFYMGIIIFGLW